MEYNTNTYITIAHSTCESLGLGENHRTNVEGTICIIEFGESEVISNEIQDHIIDTYTHQEALQLMEDVDWYKEIPQS